MNLITKATIKRDTNGNKIVTFQFIKARGFSIQTLCNLPKCHRLNIGETFQAHSNCELWEEIQGYLYNHGTIRQKDILGIKSKRK